MMMITIEPARGAIGRDMEEAAGGEGMDSSSSIFMMAKIAGETGKGVVVGSGLRVKEGADTVGISCDEELGSGARRGLAEDEDEFAIELLQHAFHVLPERQIEGENDLAIAP